MSKRNSLIWVATFAAIAVSVGSPPAKAVPVETNFGSLTTPASCVFAGGSDQGLVCASSASFTSTDGTSTLTATAYSGAPGTSATGFLTFKPENPPYTTTPNNDFAESGLGENPTAPGTACSETSTPSSCEIAMGISTGTSVAVVDNNPNDLLTDVIVGSDQAGENYIIWAGPTLSSLAVIATGSAPSCSGTTPGTGVTQGPGPVTDTCIVNFPGQLVVAVQSGGTGDVLVTSVSQPGTNPPPVTTPEPASLALLGTGIVGLGVFRRARRRVTFV